MADKKKEEKVEEEKVETVEENAAAETEATEEKPEKKTEAKAQTEEPTEKKKGKRAEKVGIVWSDKMMKTVVVRVDRLVKHSLYHKYIKKRKKFMAHDELGASVGDRVRIVETRPISARKRWRVVEIIQKAQK